MAIGWSPASKYRQWRPRQISARNKVREFDWTPMAMNMMLLVQNVHPGRIGSGGLRMLERHARRY